MNRQSDTRWHLTNNQLFLLNIILKVRFVKKTLGAGIAKGYLDLHKKCTLPGGIIAIFKMHNPVIKQHETTYT